MTGFNERFHSVFLSLVLTLVLSTWKLVKLSAYYSLSKFITKYALSKKCYTTHGWLQRLVPCAFYCTLFSQILWEAVQVLCWRRRSCSPLYQCLLFLYLCVCARNVVVSVCASVSECMEDKSSYTCASFTLCYSFDNQNSIHVLYSILYCRMIFYLRIHTLWKLKWMHQLMEILLIQKSLFQVIMLFS